MNKKNARMIMASAGAVMLAGILFIFIYGAVKSELWALIPIGIVVAAAIILITIAAKIHREKTVKNKVHQIYILSERLRAIERNAEGIGFFAMFSDKIIVYSSSFESVFGFSPIAETLDDFLTLSDLVDVGDMQKWLEFGEYINTRVEGSTLEVGITVPDGRHLKLRIGYSVINNEGGEPEEIVGHIWEIPEKVEEVKIFDKGRKEEIQRHLERQMYDDSDENMYSHFGDMGGLTAIAKSAAANTDETSAGQIRRADYTQETLESVQYRAMLDYFDGGILLFHISEEVDITYFSQSYYKMMHTKPSEVAELRGNFLNCVAPEYRDELMRSIRDSSVGNPIDVTYKVRLNEASEYTWHHMHIIRVPVGANEIPTVLAMIKDVSEFKQNEEKLSAILGNVPLSIGLFRITDSGVAAIYVNNEMYKIIGCTESEFRDELAENIGRLVYEDDCAVLIESLKKAAETKERVECIIHTKPDYDGREGVMTVFAKTLGDSEKNITFLAAIVDITEKTLLETELEEKRTSLELCNECINMTLGRTNSIIWQMEPKRKFIRVWDYRLKRYDHTRVYDNAPECLLETGKIAEESRTALMELYEKMCSGVKSASCAMKMKINDTEYSWVRVSYSFITATNCENPIAVGMTDVIINAAFAIKQIRHEQRFRKLLTEKNFSTVTLNITSDLIIDANATLKDDVSRVINGTIEDAANYIAEDASTLEDAALIRSRLRRENVLKAYERGSSWLSFEFRWGVNGKIYWLEIAMNLVNDPMSGDIFGFAYIFPIEFRKNIELTLGTAPERDLSTALYSPDSFETVLSGIGGEYFTSDGSCALAVFEIAGLKTVSATLGTSYAGRIVTRVGQYLRIIMENTCVAGKLGEGVFGVFKTEIAGIREAKLWASETEKSLKELLKILNFEQIVDIKSGVVVSPILGLNAERLIVRAISVLNSETNGDVSAKYIKNIQPVISSESGHNEKPNDLETAAVMFSCASELLLAGSFGEGAENVLKAICAYYEAETAFVAELCLDGKSFAITARWRQKEDERCEDGKLFALSDMPGINKAFEADGTTVLVKPSEEEGRYIAVPFNLEEGKRALLYIQNINGHNMSPELPEMLTPLIAGEYVKRLNEKHQRLLSYYDSMTGLLNRNSLELYVRKQKNHPMSSLGIMTTDVNAMKSINCELGNQYGDDLLMDIASLLLKTFGKKSCFRISGDEFAVISENTMESSFVQKVNNVRKLLELSHPSTICVASVWENTDPDAATMLERCELVLQNEKRALRYRAELSDDEGMTESVANLKRSIAEGWFTVYLQAKRNTRTREICGAEALVRCTDPHTMETITPDKFIPMLERQNTISYLDAFVIGETMKTLSEWKEKGLKLFPVSINLSRKTLIEPTTLSTVIELQRQYDVPRDMLEFEITDSLGSIERAGLIHICEQYKSQGFRFTLDDFGSDYSGVSFLTSMPFKIIKLDKSLVAAIEKEKGSRIVAENIHHFCDVMGIECVAEGVETEQQLNVLNEIGIHIAQGYLFDRPIPKEEFRMKYLEI